MLEARSRVLKAAVECFVTKGYAATTLADIETAAGLTRGAGGPYRHFPSKRAMLDAAIDEMLATDDQDLVPPPASLAQAARDGLAFMDSDLMRIFIRDLYQFPEIHRRVVERLVTGPTAVVAERIASVNTTVDAQAMATIAIGALINFKVIEVLAGPGSNGITEDRLVSAWAELFRLMLTSGAPATTDQRLPKKPLREKPKPTNSK
jgi:AcrR family transcriptional regulator